MGRKSGIIRTFYFEKSIQIIIVREMSNKDFDRLMEIAQESIEESKAMTKKEAIATLNRAGIFTKRGQFTKPYKALKEFSEAKSK